MVLSDIGFGALLLTLATALWATFAAVLGAQRRLPQLVASARSALFVTAGLSTLSAALLLVLLFSHDFEVRYVYEHVSTYLKPAYVLAAFWAGLEGSQLLWLWMLTIFTAVVVWRKPTWDRELRPYAMAVLAFTQAFFAFLLILLPNPFQNRDFGPFWASRRTTPIPHTGLVSQTHGHPGTVPRTGMPSSDNNLIFSGENPSNSVRRYMRPCSQKGHCFGSFPSGRSDRNHSPRSNWGASAGSFSSLPIN